MSAFDNKNIALSRRKLYFKNILEILKKNTIVHNHGELWAKFQLVPKHTFGDLVSSVDRYLVKTLANSGIHVDDVNSFKTGDVSRLLCLPWSQVKDMTPNGLIIPKHESIKIFTDILISCLEILEVIAPGKMLRYIDGAPNVRLKDSQEPESYGTPRPTELPHLDCWAGTDPNSLNLYIPIAGDVARNTIQLYDVPNSWNESWTLPRSYTQGEEIAKLYSKLDDVTMQKLTPRLGEALIWDSSVCHSTFRKFDCDARISIDLHFTPNRYENDTTLLDFNSQRCSNDYKQGVLYADDLYRLRTGDATLIAASKTGTVPSQVKGSHSAGLEIITIS